MAPSWQHKSPGALPLSAVNTVQELQKKTRAVNAAVPVSLGTAASLPQQQAALRAASGTEKYSNTGAAQDGTGTAVQRTQTALSHTQQQVQQMLATEPSPTEQYPSPAAQLTSVITAACAQQQKSRVALETLLCKLLSTCQQQMAQSSELGQQMLHMNFSYEKAMQQLLQEQLKQAHKDQVQNELIEVLKSRAVDRDANVEEFKRLAQASSELQAQLDSAKEAAAAAIEAAAASSIKVANLQQQLAASQAAEAGYKAEIERLVRLNRTQLEVAAATDQISNLEKQLEQERQQNSSNEEALDKLKLRLQAEETDNKQLKAKVESLEEQLEQEQQTSKQVAAESKELQRVVQDLQQKLAASSAVCRPIQQRTYLNKHGKKYYAFKYNEDGKPLNSRQKPCKNCIKDHACIWHKEPVRHLCCLCGHEE